MAKPPSGPVRCAIYTRKSTEEGLEQEFNTLDAQREACEAYIKSQLHEGWVLTPGAYDDGGFSGGNLNRPGLQRLLAEVKSGKVDVIVVYKIDRLTRSLADFAKIVEVLDAAEASFVSVTQSFNTTTSMGRLTLNVLLSFAQFEREVTGERIRDKIAASKAKGMWMGGVVPLGYDVRERKLLINEAEAETVRLIFNRFLELGSMLALQMELEKGSIRSKLWISTRGNSFGGAVLSRGALYFMLQNRIYVGEIRHKGKCFPGEHQGIVARETFDAVQARLAENREGKERRNGRKPSLLAGILWDQHGGKLTPTHTTRHVKRYRYYASVGNAPAAQTLTWRIPAGELEEAVVARVRSYLQDDHAVHASLGALNTGAAALEGFFAEAAVLAAATEEEPNRHLLRPLLQRVEVHLDRIEIAIRPGMLMRGEGGHLPVHVLSQPAELVRGPKDVRLVVGGHASAADRRDPALIKLVVSAYRARSAVEQRPGECVDEIAASQIVGVRHFRVLLRISYLANPIVAAILEGRQPLGLTRQKLAHMSDLPLDWEAQALKLGFSSLSAA